MYKRVLAIALFTAYPSTSVAGELVTPSFRIVVTESCPEGETMCQNVSYTGTSKRTGKSIKLKGKTLSRMCPDGITPCQHIGYEFKNGAYVYFVGDNGRLLVTRKGKTIVSETGQWAF